MTGYPEKKFCTNNYQYKETYSKNAIQKSAISKKQNSGKRFLKELLVSYEQKNKFEEIILMKQPIFLLPLSDSNQHLSKEWMSPMCKNISKYYIT